MMRKIIDREYPAIVAGLTALIMGVLVHLFGLVNMLHNYDDIYVQPSGFGTGIRSGRWFLEFLGLSVRVIFGGYNMPWLNGIIFIALISITAAFLVSALCIKNPVASGLIGAVFVTFPTVTATLMFKYTTIYYGIAVLLSVLAAWVFSRYKYGFFVSSLFTALALGIYQAYVPITIGIFVLLLIKQILEENMSIRACWYKGIQMCGSMILGFFIYWLLQWLAQRITGISLGSYQGIDKMGQLSISQIPQLIGNAYKSFFLLPIDDYASLAQTWPLKFAYLVLMLAAVGTGIFAAIVNRRTAGQTAMIALLLLLLPLAMNFIVIMCPEGNIYTLMVYAIVLLPCVPLALFETMPVTEGRPLKLKKLIANGIVLVLLFTICCNSYLANKNYTALYYANRQAENYLSTMVTQVRMTEGFDTQKKWVFLGDISDPLLDNEWQREAIYGGNANVLRLINAYSRHNWIELYYGYTLPRASNAESQQLQENELVKQMPCWPDEGSIKVIDQYIVIKFS